MQVITYIAARANFRNALFLLRAIFAASGRGGETKEEEEEVFVWDSRALRGAGAFRKLDGVKMGRVAAAECFF